MKISIAFLFLSILFSGCDGDSSAQKEKWKGNWARTESQDGAELEIKKINGDTLSFILFATNGASYSQLEGTALLKYNKATFLADADNVLADCEFVFELKGDSTISISEGGSECGNAMYAWYAGNYGKGRNK